MLMWVTQNETNLPDKVRQRIIKIFNRGYTFEDDTKDRIKRLPHRAHAVAIIYRNNRYDLYPFNRINPQSFRKAAAYTEAYGTIVEYDFHTEGYPLHDPMFGIQPWLEQLYDQGLIDAFVLKDRDDIEPQVYTDGVAGYRTHSPSEYKLYFIHNRVMYPLEWWLKERDEYIPLSEAYYNYGGRDYVRVADVGRLMPEVRKMMRRYTTSWLRANARQDANL